jgi:hypothetical protein
VDPSDVIVDAIEINKVRAAIHCGLSVFGQAHQRRCH